MNAINKWLGKCLLSLKLKVFNINTTIYLSRQLEVMTNDFC